jgi:hypothetical protein
VYPSPNLSAMLGHSSTNLKAILNAGGAVQSVCMHMELRKPHMKETYPDAIAGFGADVEQAFGVNLKHQYGNVLRCLEAKQNKIIRPPA